MDLVFKRLLSRTLWSLNGEKPSSQTRACAEWTSTLPLSRMPVALRGEDTNCDVNTPGFPGLYLGQGVRALELEPQGDRTSEGTLRRYYPKLQTYCVKSASSTLATPTDQNMCGVLASVGHLPLGCQGHVPDLLSSSSLPRPPEKAQLSLLRGCEVSWR